MNGDYAAEPPTPTPADVLQQAERILHSTEFAGAELLRNLLSFLVKRAVEKPGEAAKEYEVAREVLGRAEHFDPRLDSAVRVNTARLRSKLSAYYVSEGAADRVVIEIPKGAYQLSWHYRDEGTPAGKPKKERRRRWQWVAAAFAAGALLGATAVQTWLASRSRNVPAPLMAFWRPFLESPQEPLAVFSNPRFAGSVITGLHYFREGIDAPGEMNDTYSGTGTVMAAHELTKLFSLMGHSIRLKRAELLTWDEAKNTNVVFLGSPASNSRVRELAPLQEFAFKSALSEPALGMAGFTNLHPRPGDEAIYLTPAKPYTSDYAIVAMLPGLKPERRVLLLAGTNTYGLQAAADFICRADLVGNLLSRLGVRDPGRIPDFEALLHVKVNGGVPIEPRLVLLRPRGPAPVAR